MIAASLFFAHCFSTGAFRKYVPAYCSIYRHAPKPSRWLLSLRLRADAMFEPYVINAGQHREMIEQVVQLFGIEVDADLAAMEPSQTLAGLTGATSVERIDQAASRCETRYGFGARRHDDRTLREALASFYRDSNRARRSRATNWRHPFASSEEANRRLVSPLVLPIFGADGDRALPLAERVPDDSIFVTGNTVIDALLTEVRRQEHEEVRGACSMMRSVTSRRRLPQAANDSGHRPSSREL